MDQFKKFDELLAEIINFANHTNLVKLFEDQSVELNELRDKNNALEIELKNRKQELLDLHHEYITEIKNKDIEIEQLKADMTNLSKVSLIVSTRRELDEKNKYIKLLESQIEKHKNTLLLEVTETKKDSRTVSDNTETISSLSKQESINEEEPETKLNDGEAEVKVKKDKSSKKKVINEEEAIIEEPEIKSKKNKSNKNKFDNDEPEIKQKKDKSNKNKVINEEPIIQEIIIEEPIIQELVNQEPIIEELEIKHNKDIAEQENVEDNQPKIKKSKSKERKVSTESEPTFDPDLFEDISGYELIIYKKCYYLKDLETDEIHDIVNYKPNTKVGFINSSGKVKFNY